MSLNAAKNGAHSGIMRKAVLANGEDLWAYPPPEILEKLEIGAASSAECFLGIGFVSKDLEALGVDLEHLKELKRDAITPY